MTPFDYILFFTTSLSFISWFNLNRVKKKYGFIDIHERLMFSWATVFSLIVEGLYFIALCLWVVKDTSMYIKTNIGSCPEFYNYAEVVKSLIITSFNLFVTVTISSRGSNVFKKIKRFFDKYIPF